MKIASWTAWGLWFRSAPDVVEPQSWESECHSGGSMTWDFIRQEAKVGRSRAVGLCLTVAAALLVVACSGPALPALPGLRSSEAITPTTAQSVVRDYWKTNELASMHRDPRLFARTETGLLLETDQASIKVDQALRNPRLASPRPLRRVTPYVPRQSGFPQEFVALIDTVQIDETGHPNDAPSKFYLHFTRPSVGEDWKADFYAQVKARTFNFALDSAGYATSLPAGASRFVLRPDGLAPALATYQQTGVLSGTPTGPFAPGPMTSYSVNLQRAHHDQMTMLGYNEATDFQALPYLHAYRAVDGSAIVLFALRPSDTVTLPDPSICIIQPASLRQWGALVPAGNYASVTIDNLLEYMATNPVARPGAQVEVIGIGDDQVAARTVPSPLSGCG